MTALIFGILGLTVLPGIGSVVAILAGRRHPDDPLARAGVVLGWIGVALFFVGCCVGAASVLLPTVAGLSALKDFQTPTPATLWLATPTPSAPTPTAGERGYLGIRCEDRGGAMVAEVLPGSPAERAGLQAGDVVTHVDGEYVPYCSDLAKVVAEQSGQTVRLSILRAGKIITIEVLLGAR